MILDSGTKEVAKESAQMLDANASRTNSPYQNVCREMNILPVRRRSAKEMDNEMPIKRKKTK